MSLTQFGDAFVPSPSGVQPPVHVARGVHAQVQLPSSPSVQRSSASVAAAGVFGVVAAGAAALNKNSAKGASRQKRIQTTLSAFESELGVQAPTGFWDPVGFTADGDIAAFKRRRSVELKHGRICMMATMGYITPEVVGKLPGYLSPSAGLKFADIPNGLAAISKVPTAGWAQIAAYFGFVEFSGGFDDYKSGTPGDYGFKVLTSSDPEEKTKKLNAEIANSRLAMVAIIGMFFQDGLTGQAWGDWASYTASPLRAFESELGVQAPAGFWDPLGFTTDGDAERFRRRRAVELKHGRVSMIACIGYIVPEYYRFEGYLAPSVGLKFEDVPNGLAALSKVPASGIAQMISFVATVELWIFLDDPTRAPGDFQNAGILGVPFVRSTLPDGDAKKKKLSAEIANGRLAMMAIIGMFFQDGLTGSAWGDWANYTDSPLRAFEGETGVQAPVGYWDPLGLAADGNAFDFKRRREVELKHGRVAMFATIGYIVPEYYRLSGYLSPSYGVKFNDVPNGLGAISKVPALGWLQFFIFIGLIEINVYGENVNGEPGNYGAGFLGLRSVGVMNTGITDPEVRKKKLNAELANGRLAMMAIIGMFFQDGCTGTAWGDWSLYTDSPLRAFEAELGVQAPVGFWDPLGLASDGDSANFKRRRAVELKHGRISMLACIGYIVPEYFRWPGFVSPSMGLKFADVPNGLAALSKIPVEGTVQIVLFLAHYEGKFFRQDASRSPGDFENYGFLGIGKNFIFNFDPPQIDQGSRQKKLAAEIANGRLAMVAIIGMFYQDGLTGSAWGDWTLYTDSPLRAFENELGVQAPVGFFDPLGLSKDGDVETFKRRRSSEVKHGRIAMLATMGYITPEICGKFPGFLDPTSSPRLAFEDIPNGLAAVSKVPTGGWLQIVAYAGWVEAMAGFGKDAKETPGEMGFKPPLLSGGDEATKARRLNSELANGRLAMMAIIGMFFQDGLTGSAWGDWANYTDSPLR